MESTRVPSYVYMLARGTEEVEVASEAPPEQFLDALQSFASLLGHQWDHTSVVVYGKKASEAMWYPLDDENSTPTLIPLFPSVPKPLDEDEYFKIGKQALDAYTRLQNNIQYLSRHDFDTEDKEMLNTIQSLKTNLQTIERVFENTEWGSVFELKYKLREKQHVCAARLHVSTRTWSRKVHDMVAYTGKVLCENLKPSQLGDLIDASRRY